MQSRHKSNVILHFLRLSDVVDRMSSVAGLAATLSVDGKGWPFVTEDAFPMRANNARLHSGALYLSINPIVRATDLDSWESYVQSPANSWM
jgi:hypothetical protein